MNGRLLTWQDLAHIFKCGRGKALRILHQVGATYVGRTPMVSADQLIEYLNRHNGEIKVDWR